MEEKAMMSSFPVSSSQVVTSRLLVFTFPKMKFTQTWLHHPPNRAKLLALLGFSFFSSVYPIKGKHCWTTSAPTGKRPSVVLDPPVSTCFPGVKQLLTSWFMTARCNVLFLIRALCRQCRSHAYPQNTRWPWGSNYSALKNNVITGRTLHKVTKSPRSVFTRVKLLHSYLCRAVSINCTCPKTPGGISF